MITSCKKMINLVVIQNTIKDELIEDNKKLNSIVGDFAN